MGCVQIKNMMRDLRGYDANNNLIAVHCVQFWCSLNLASYHVNVAYGSPLFANFHTPAPSLVAITVGGWMGVRRACVGDSIASASVFTEFQLPGKEGME